MTNNKPLYVSSPLLPDLKALEPLLQSIWSSKWVTNHGDFHQALEARLKTELKVPVASVFNNGTIALLVALKVFNFEPGSEIITTPFTFAATAHAITWNAFKPVFVDVDPVTMTIDPESVEMAITRKTQAILGVHVYGNVCDTESLKHIASKYNLKLIYDAAHAFGVEVNGCGIGSYGDASIFSFHATKLFNTIEGGCITTSISGDENKIYSLRNFGIKDENAVTHVGINGKMNEIQAAIGLLNLDIYKKEKQLRAKLRKQYNQALTEFSGISTPITQAGVSSSEQYYPVRINSDISGFSRDELYDALKRINIFTRKYFFPICTEFLPYCDFTIISKMGNHLNVEKIKKEVLCLPFHSGVQENDICRIMDTIKKLS